MYMNDMTVTQWKKCLQNWKATSDAARLSVRPHGTNRFHADVVKSVLPRRQIVNDDPEPGRDEIVPFTCALCGSSISWGESTPIMQVTSNEMLQQLVAEICRGCPLFCSSCASLCRRAEKNGRNALSTPDGQRIVSVAEAAAARDWAELKRLYDDTQLCDTRSVRFVPEPAHDMQGRLHLPVLQRATCKWEPFIGSTAREARAKALTHSSMEMKAAHCCYNYFIGRSTEPISRANVQDVVAVESRGGDYGSILKDNGVSAFARPFYHIMLLTLPVGKRIHSLAAKRLRSDLHTSYGPGRIVNRVAFNYAHVVLEDTADVRGRGDAVLKFERAVVVLCGFLYFSPFGEAIMNACGLPEPKQLCDVPTRFQRFMYKLCELRKMCVAYKRCRYYGKWKGDSYRESFEKGLCSKYKKGKVLKEFLKLR